MLVHIPRSTCTCPSKYHLTSPKSRKKSPRSPGSATQLPHVTVHHHDDAIHPSISHPDTQSTDESRRTRHAYLKPTVVCRSNVKQVSIFPEPDRAVRKRQIDPKTQNAKPPSLKGKAKGKVNLHQSQHYSRLDGKAYMRIEITVE